MKVTLSLATIAFSVISNVANANPDFDLIYMMQYKLNKHGFSVGEPDGKLGPATKKGLAAFADEYGTSENAEDVIQRMLKLSSAARIPVTDEKMLSIIQSGVADLLRDPSSVMLRNVYTVRDADFEIVCGEVNGRNAYGGYAGYTAFSGVYLMNTFIFSGMDDGETRAVALQCALAFPKK
jgi:hypothetical protein